MARINQVTALLLRFEDDGIIPNSRFPVLLYQRAIDWGVARKEQAEKWITPILHQNGWKYERAGTPYHFVHYHSTVHMCIIVIRGSADLPLGGPKGEERHFTRGDVLILPAGVAYKGPKVSYRRVNTNNFQVILATYPADGKMDICRETERDRQKAWKNLRKVPFPHADPIYGTKGMLQKCWK